MFLVLLVISSILCLYEYSVDCWGYVLPLSACCLFSIDLFSISFYVEYIFGPCMKVSVIISSHVLTAGAVKILVFLKLLLLESYFRYCSARFLGLLS